MAICYITEQGAKLVKRGNRLLVMKWGEQIQWFHAFKVEQVILMGNVILTPGTIAFLLKEGIDTVFMSIHGKYRGRLISAFGKNIELRRLQFRKFEEPEVRLALAKKFIQGKLNNCRILLRRHNRKIRNQKVTRAINRLRILGRQVPKADSVGSLRGIEGKGAACYFGCLGELIKVDDIRFVERNRRPPKDPVNVLLSLGYTFLGNTMQTQVDIAGLDPFLGCLHEVEYGRPSLVLDLIEEFRPVLVDALVLTLINKRIIRTTHFYRPDEMEPPAFDFAGDQLHEKNYPIILNPEGMKRFITNFEAGLNRKVFHIISGKRLTWRQILLEQVRLLVRHLKEESEYESHKMR